MVQSLRLSSTRRADLPDGGRQLGQAIGQRHADGQRFAVAERIDQAAGQLGRRAGRDQVEQLGGGRVVFLQIDKLRGGGEAVGVGQIALLARRQEAGGHLGDLLAELLAAPARGERGDLGFGGGRELVEQRR